MDCPRILELSPCGEHEYIYYKTLDMPRTKRIQNKCKSCGNTWYPKGKNLSLKCPNCGSNAVTYAGCGCFFWLAIIVIIGVVAVIVSSGNANKSEKDTDNTNTEMDKVLKSDPNDEKTRLPEAPLIDPNRNTSALELTKFSDDTILPVTVVLARRVAIIHSEGVKGVRAGEKLTIQQRTPEGYVVLLDGAAYEIPRDSLIDAVIHK